MSLGFGLYDLLYVANGKYVQQIHISIRTSIYIVCCVVETIYTHIFKIQKATINIRTHTHRQTHIKTHCVYKSQIRICRLSIRMECIEQVGRYTYTLWCVLYLRSTNFDVDTQKYTQQIYKSMQQAGNQVLVYVFVFVFVYLGYIYCIYILVYLVHTYLIWRVL